MSRAPQCAGMPSGTTARGGQLTMQADAAQRVPSANTKTSTIRSAHLLRTAWPQATISSIQTRSRARTASTGSSSKVMGTWSFTRPEKLSGRLTLTQWQMPKPNCNKMGTSSCIRMETTRHRELFGRLVRQVTTTRPPRSRMTVISSFVMLTGWLFGPATQTKLTKPMTTDKTPKSVPPSASFRRVGLPIRPPATTIDHIGARWRK
mmetsp:Transcript_54743/g.150904  ORF Transcript_54743/g.150904 Transcript_54743/m.150904 type:complete len:206 (+) Transcript_54743:176-793(+)